MGMNWERSVLFWVDNGYQCKGPVVGSEARVLLQLLRLSIMTNYEFRSLPFELLNKIERNGTLPDWNNNFL
jgi:hypothetical protein